MNDVPIYLSSSTSDTATFSYDGNDYEAIRSEEEVTVNDLSDSSCTALFTGLGHRPKILSPRAEPAAQDMS